MFIMDHIIRICKGRFKKNITKMYRNKQKGTHDDNPEKEERKRKRKIKKKKPIKIRIIKTI